MAQPFDGYFELRLTDAADTYTSVMALDDIEQLRSGQRNQAWQPAAGRRARPNHRPRMPVTVLIMLLPWLAPCGVCGGSLLQLDRAAVGERERGAAAAHQPAQDLPRRRLVAQGQAQIQRVRQDHAEVGTPYTQAQATRSSHIRQRLALQTLAGHGPPWLAQPVLTLRPGCLVVWWFRLDLGISGHELRMIIAEADENDDGVIDYREFVPVAIELIQSFKARQEVGEHPDSQPARSSRQAGGQSGRTNRLSTLGRARTGGVSNHCPFIQLLDPSEVLPLPRLPPAVVVVHRGGVCRPASRC